MINQKYTKPFDNIFSHKDDLLNIVNKFEELIEISEESERIDYINFILGQINPNTHLDAEIIRQLIYCIQRIQIKRLIPKRIKGKIYKTLFKFCTSKIFIKRLNVSAAVSKTLREFYNDPDISSDLITNSLLYFIGNMVPIKGWGARMTQASWTKSFKDMIIKSDYNWTKEQNTILNNITGMNLFKEKLDRSYDVDKNISLNIFYNTFFNNVSEILIYDKKSINNASYELKSKESSIMISYEPQKKICDEMQKKGVDKKLIFKGKDEILIEEKFREPKYWENRNKDILIEYMSNDEKNELGWIYKTISDYIIYLFIRDEEYGEVYVFPTKPLKNWVLRNKRDFMEYQELRAPNMGYYTLSKAVPLKKIKDIIQKAGYEAFYTEIHPLKIGKYN